MFPNIPAFRLAPVFRRRRLRVTRARRRLRGLTAAATFRRRRRPPRLRLLGFTTAFIVFRRRDRRRVDFRFLRLATLILLVRYLIFVTTLTLLRLLLLRRGLVRAATFLRRRELVRRRRRRGLDIFINCPFALRRRPFKVFFRRLRRAIEPPLLLLLSFKPDEDFFLRCREMLFRVALEEPARPEIPGINPPYSFE